MTNAERLQHPCPNCHAKAGDPCHDYTGKNTARPHKTRGPGQLEAHLAAEAERKAARGRKPYGPLFAELAAVEVPVATVDEMKLRKRFEKAHGAETGSLCSKPNAGLEWLRLQFLFVETAKIVGEEWGTKVLAAGFRIYGTIGKGTYIVGHFRQFLTEASEAKPMALSHEIRCASSCRRRVTGTLAQPNPPSPRN